MYFVYVRYVFDKVTKVTTSNHVKGFKPKDCNDFKTGDVYSVYWEGDSHTAGAYYEAEILHMTESKEEMDKYREEARSRHVSKRHYEPSADSAADKAHKPKKNRLVAKQVAASKILEEMSTEKTSELHNEISELKEENRRLRCFNMKLQEELLNCLSEARMQASNTMCHCGRGREMSPPGTRRDFIQAPITSDHGEEAAGSEQVAQSELPVSRQLFTETVQDKALQQRPSPAVCSVMDNGMVHLSNNVNITKDVYDMLMAMPKDSLFVKRAATAIWSSEVLARRSFSGMLSNRFLSEGGDKAPQKPLTPQKVDALKGK
ncbi:hypothetical protein HPB49_026264 [Dermacentor silvarum]|nr:hypothetical protein HPB49_026264 [Dermacentor silvarum]